MSRYVGYHDISRSSFEENKKHSLHIQAKVRQDTSAL